MACSALKRAYRDMLLREGAGGDADKLLFVRPTVAAPPQNATLLPARALRGGTEAGLLGRTTACMAVCQQPEAGRQPPQSSLQKVSP